MSSNSLPDDPKMLGLVLDDVRLFLEGAGPLPIQRNCLGVAQRRGSQRTRLASVFVRQISADIMRGMASLAKYPPRLIRYFTPGEHAGIIEAYERLKALGQIEDQFTPDDRARIAALQQRLKALGHLGDPSRHSASQAKLTPEGLGEILELLTAPFRRVHDEAVAKLARQSTPKAQSDLIEEAARKREGAPRLAEFLRYLGRQPDRKASLDQIAIDMDKAPEGKASRRRGTIRQRFNRTRDRLEQEGGPVRLTIENKVIELKILTDEPRHATPL